VGRFRKRPVEIEAVQVQLVPWEASWGNGVTAKMLWSDAVVAQDFLKAVCWERDTEVGLPHIHTLEGAHAILDRDWIVRGVKGEFYPVKHDIFDLTYEPVGTTAGDVPNNTPDAMLAQREDR
jgi:hypothetical protein